MQHEVDVLMPSKPDREDESPSEPAGRHLSPKRVSSSTARYGARRTDAIDRTLVADLVEQIDEQAGGAITPRLNGALRYGNVQAALKDDDFSASHRDHELVLVAAGLVFARRMSEYARQLRKRVAQDIALTERLEAHPGRARAVRRNEKATGQAVEPSETLTSALSLAMLLERRIQGLIETWHDIGQTLDAPRMPSLADGAPANTETVRSALDGKDYATITRTLKSFSIDADDYRRLFAVPNDQPLWSETMSKKRAAIATTSHFWSGRSGSARSKKKGAGKSSTEQAPDRD